MAKLNFRHMEIFWAVMTTGSATAAAELLHTSQPTVSRELSRLQLVLFKRANARLIPTEQALRLFEEVERAYFGMERIERTAEAIRQHKHGQIALVTLPAFSQALLPRVCKRFLGQYPDVALSITPQEAPLLNEWLSSQRYDLGLIEEATVPIGTESDCVFTSDMVCVLPTDHRLADKSVLSPRDFEQSPPMIPIARKSTRCSRSTASAGDWWWKPTAPSPYAAPSPTVSACPSSTRSPPSPTSTSG